MIYGLDDRPALRQRIPLGIQHLVAMLLGNITPPLLIAGGLGLAVGDTTFLLQMALLFAGVATLVQAYPIGPIGGRLPIVMGTSIAFVGASLAAAREWGLAALFGACLAAALVEVVLGFSIPTLKRAFPPLVNGVVVMLIGLTLVPVGIDYAAGGPGAADYGAPVHLGIAAIVFVATLVLNQWGRDLVAAGSMLFGVVIGYGVAVALGLVDFGPVAEAGWFALPSFLPYGLEFHLGPIVLLGMVYVVSAMETLGDVAGTVAALGRSASDRELRGSLVADGVMSGVSCLFGALPNTSYSQNVGLISFCGVASRHVTGMTGILLVLLGLVPKIGALFATIPPAVIGGGGLVMFGMIFSSGLGIVHRQVTLDRRAMVILAVAIGLGLGIELRPAVLDNLSENLRTLFGTGLVTGGLAALLLNLILPSSRERGRR